MKILEKNFAKEYNTLRKKYMGRVISLPRMISLFKEANMPCSSLYMLSYRQHGMIIPNNNYFIMPSKPIPSNIIYSAIDNVRKISNNYKQMKYVICNYSNCSVIELLESDNFIKVEKRLKQLNKGHNNELIIMSLHNYNKLIKSLVNKLNQIKNITQNV